MQKIYNAVTGYVKAMTSKLCQQRNWYTGLNYAYDFIKFATDRRNPTHFDALMMWYTGSIVFRPSLGYSYVSFKFSRSRCNSYSVIEQLASYVLIPDEEMHAVCLTESGICAVLYALLNCIKDS